MIILLCRCVVGRYLKKMFCVVFGYIGANCIVGHCLKTTIIIMINSIDLKKVKNIRKH